MNANGQRFWALSSEGHWSLPEVPPRVRYDRDRRSLRLASSRALPDAPDLGETEALARVGTIPQAVDRFGAQAFWDTSSSSVVSETQGLPGVVQLFEPTSGTPTDLAMGFDGVLYIALEGKVVFFDLRDRWDPVTVESVDIQAWRLAADPSGGAWVLDESGGIGRVDGAPFPRRPREPYADKTWRPCPENSDPPRLTVLEKAVFEPGEKPVSISSSSGGRIAVLVWTTEGEGGLRVLGEDGSLGPRAAFLRDEGEALSFPYSMSWVSERRIAVLVAGLKEAAVYEEAVGPMMLMPVGDIYPLRDHDGGPFLNGTEESPRYPTGLGSSSRLNRLMLPSFARNGKVSNRAQLDSGSAQTVWHRLYLEADLPPGCGVRVDLASGDAPVAPTDESLWYAHYFGGADPGDARAPRGAWLPESSELPFHRGLLFCESREKRAGLFTCLIQRSTRAVTSLRGRYLWVRLTLIGDGRSTPEVAGLRAYASRFSYVDNYLPELYQENVFGPDADEARPSTPSDFLERFLGNFEGLLTSLEDRIANAHLLTDARTIPSESLDWLGSWVGVSFEPGFPEARRRGWLMAASDLHRWHGTLRGLGMALEIATGGSVSGGEIVILEDFRLRRTFATILGADLDNAADPLLGGITSSGNSYVGDTLFLGEERRKEFLALFDAELPTDAREQEAIREFFDRLAHRATVLVHEEVEPQDLGLIRRIVDLETPAHVRTRVVTATRPFMVGMASLVGVDSYLGPPWKLRSVEINRSRIGRGDVLGSEASLDPRVGMGHGAAVVLKPVADAGESLTAELGDDVTLDGSGSRSFGGRSIIRYRWTRMDGEDT